MPDGKALRDAAPAMAAMAEIIADRHGTASRALRDAAPIQYRRWLTACERLGRAHQCQVLAVRIAHAGPHMRAERMLAAETSAEIDAWEDLLIAAGRDESPAVGGSA